MAKSKQTWNKKEREKIKQKKKQDKEKRKEARKATPLKSGLDDMLAYVDQDGNITSTPPDESKKEKIKAEEIEIGIPKREASDEDSKLRTGILNYFNEAKGFGFIKDAVTHNEIFVHVSEFVDDIRENDKVNYETVKGQKGLNAINVRRI